MKKKVTSILLMGMMIFGLVGLTACGDTKIKNTVGKTEWGMSQQEIFDSEGADSEELDDEHIQYISELSGLPALLNFHTGDGNRFDDELYLAAYSIKDSKYEEGQKYIDDYKKVVSDLEKELGEPVKENKKWRNEKYKEDKDNWGKAFKEGHVSFSTQWEVDDVIVNAVMLVADPGEGNYFTFLVEYDAKELVLNSHEE